MFKLHDIFVRINVIGIVDDVMFYIMRLMTTPCLVTFARWQHRQRSLLFLIIFLRWCFVYWH